MEQDWKSELERLACAVSDGVWGTRRGRGCVRPMWRG